MTKNLFPPKPTCLLQKYFLFFSSPPFFILFYSYFILSIFLFIFPLLIIYLSNTHFSTQTKITKPFNSSKHFKTKRTSCPIKNSLFQNKITKPLTPPTLFKTNYTFFTSDFLFFLFPFFQYSSDAVVINNEIY